jgi:hypothetical protein
MTRQVPALLAALFVLFAQAAAAQETWVQIEARSSLTQAEERARAWSSAFSDVQGYRLASGWYAVVLGPYDPDAARARLQALRSERLIPPDSFVADGAQFRGRFWPVGLAPSAPSDTAPEATVPGEAAIPEPDLADPETPGTGVATAPEPEDETPAEARRSEAELDAEARQALQTALQWFGFYSGGIDGAFGRGTRASMAEWQAANGYEPTGILTLRQRRALIGSWQGELDALGLGRVVEQRAGIEIDMPVRLVEFDDYAPPFVRYRERDGSGVEILLISQNGSQATLDGLYDVMQTLEIVPLQGFRERTGTEFVLTGQDARIHSYSYARLADGMIKGFTLVYPPGEEAAMQKAIAVMRESLTSIGPALDPTLGTQETAQARDLLSGLEVRRAALTRTGVFVDGEGAVLTVVEAVEGCARVTLEDAHDARVVATDTALGLALVRPETALAPARVAALAGGTPRIGGQAAIAGFPFGPALPAATVTFGTVEDVAGLGGEAGMFRLSALTEPQEAGGPVLDATGQVAGLLLPVEAGAAAAGGRILPPEVRFAAGAEVVARFLAANGVAPSSGTGEGALAGEDLTRAAMGMTALVSCWK